MIEVRELTKRYGVKIAVENVSFSVGEGEVLGLLGPNGAGKSTIMNIMTGYLSATDGTVTVGGYDILEQPGKAKTHIGYLPEQPPLYLDMTVEEYLRFCFRLKKLKGNKRQHIAQVCEKVGIEDVASRRIGNLSRGYRQRVGLAQALLGSPPILILDEPTVGLDPRQITDIRNLIKELGKHHTVILSSHILSEVQAICPRVVVIHQGHMIADGSPKSLASSMAGGHRLYARIDGPREPVRRMLEQIPGVEAVEELGPREGALEWAISPKEGVDVRRPLFYGLSRNRWPLLSLQDNEMSLEEIFLALTAQAEEQARQQALGEKALEEEEADLFEEDVEEKEESL
ncbi:MAG: ABC transporter ATP-binding protein [Oscillospiraceae bacterium]|jgi:ABC-2 type transport system ATP-binding protein